MRSDDGDVNAGVRRVHDQIGSLAGTRFSTFSQNRLVIDSVHGGFDDGSAF